MEKQDNRQTIKLFLSEETIVSQNHFGKQPVSMVTQLSQMDFHYQEVRLQKALSPISDRKEV